MVCSFLVFLRFPKVRLSISGVAITENVHPVDKEHKQDVRFRKFSRQLIHTALSQILQPLKPEMTKPEIVHCPDWHYRKAVFGLGPYIADYPEQCTIACIVQGWCPKYVLSPLTVIFSHLMSVIRCLTRLSGGRNIGSGGLRSLEHTIRALETYELGELWEKYGLVGDLVVCWAPTLMFILPFNDLLAFYRRLPTS